MSLINVISQEKLLERQDEWSELVKRSSSQTVFMQPAYQLAWMNAFTTSQQRLLRGFTNQQDELVGVLSLFGETEKNLRIVGAVDLSDYLDLVVEPTQAEKVYQQIVAFLSHEVADWQILKLESLSKNSVTLNIFAELAREQKWRVIQSQQTVCPVITLPKTWDAYIQKLDSKRRKDFRRQLRDLGSDNNITYRCLEKPVDVKTAMPMFIELHKKSEPDKQTFWTPAREKFFIEMATALAEKNWVKLYFLDVDDEPAATVLLFDYHNQFLAYNAGFDAYRFGYLSVGNALLLHCIKDAIDVGRTRFDFMRGDEPYKFGFAAEAEPLFDLIITR